MQSIGWDVHAISSPGPLLDAFQKAEGIETHALEMPRRITPLQDVATIARLRNLIRALSPKVVHSHTPKGGLLGMLAAAATNVPVRIYHMHGLPFTTAKGLRRHLLTTTERTSSAAAHVVLCQSHSLRLQALEHSICGAQKIQVLENGSLGIDAINTFNPNNHRSHRLELRNHLGWNDNHVVCGFMGRLVRDKGIIDLAVAWQAVSKRLPHARLLLVGPFEAQDPVPASIRAQLERDPTVHLEGFSPDPAKWYSAMDVLVLPSYREGFPTAPLEAAAMTLPVVATRIPGTVDAVTDGITGTLVPTKSPQQLAQAIAGYAINAPLRKEHGNAGRSRVLKNFSRESIWTAMGHLYARLAGERGHNTPRPPP